MRDVETQSTGVKAKTDGREWPEKPIFHFCSSADRTMDGREERDAERVSLRNRTDS